MRYVIEVSDRQGTSCRIRLSIPFLSSSANTENSSWQVLDEGLLRYRSGGCGAVKPRGIAPTQIVLKRGNHRLLWIFAMFDWLGMVNASGTGELAKEATLALEPGEVTWALIR